MPSSGPSKMGPRQVQYWKGITPRPSPKNFNIGNFGNGNRGIKKGGSGPKKIK